MSGRFDRTVEGKMTIDGVTTEFHLSIDGYSQWGADTMTLGDRVEYLAGMLNGLNEEGFFAEPEEDEDDG